MTSFVNDNRRHPLAFLSKLTVKAYYDTILEEISDKKRTLWLLKKQSVN